MGGSFLESPVGFASLAALYLVKTMTDTNQLLHQYAHHGSEPAFRELVTCYLDLVYTVALRRAGGNTHQAEDITQTVFSDLARKAPSLPPKVMLGGWLHRHTCFVASTQLRFEIRRQNREREAVQMNTLHAAPDDTWVQLGPVLDDALINSKPPTARPSCSAILNIVICARWAWRWALARTRRKSA